jgi:hypothetical protein
MSPSTAESVVSTTVHEKRPSVASASSVIRGKAPFARAFVGAAGLAGTF